MRLNLVVIRVADIERSASFYRALGLTLTKEQHGNGPEHYAADIEGTVLELYPQSPGEDSTTRVRLGFKVNGIDSVVKTCSAAGGHIAWPAKRFPWGHRAVIEDPDGHRIELVETVQQ